MLIAAVGAEGIGFAIPVATAKTVLEQIIKHGKVIRGWIGADYTDLTVAANSGLPAAARGAHVTAVYAGSPAAQAGLQPRRRAAAHRQWRPILDPTDLRNREAALKPGTKVEAVRLAQRRARSIRRCDRRNDRR